MLRNVFVLFEEKAATYSTRGNVIQNRNVRSTLCKVRMSSDDVIITTSFFPLLLYSLPIPPSLSLYFCFHSHFSFFSPSFSAILFCLSSASLLLQLFFSFPFLLPSPHILFQLPLLCFLFSRLLYSPLVYSSASLLLTWSSTWCSRVSSEFLQPSLELIQSLVSRSVDHWKLTTDRHLSFLEKEEDTMTSSLVRSDEPS